MTYVMDEFVKEILKAQAKKIALAVIALGKMSLEEIAEAVDLPLAEVEELAKKKSA